MGNYVRIIVSILLAIPVVIGLFMVMHNLIDREFENPEVSNTKIAELVQPDEEIELQTAVKKPEKVEDPEEPPPDLDTPDVDMDVDVEVVNTAPQASVDVAIGVGANLTNDGEYLPIVKVAPVYPRRAQTRGIEGYVLLEFIVTKTGAVANPVVIESSPPGIFDRAAINAALKFKYKPKVVDGEPIDVAGVRNRITFELAD